MDKKSRMSDAWDCGYIALINSVLILPMPGILAVRFTSFDR